MRAFGRILSRYVFWQAAGAVLLILVSLTTVVWIAVALRQLELMTSQGQDALRFLIMTTLAIPSLLALIAPIALLIASIHVLNRLNSDSELIIMTAGGAPVWVLLKPLGVLALLVALGVSAVNHIAGPWSQRLLREYSVLVRTDLIGQVIQPWRFTEPEAKLTVAHPDRDLDGHLLGLLMHDARDPKQIASYLAERAQIIKQGRKRLSAHGEGAHRAPPPDRDRHRRSSHSPSMSWTSISSSSGRIRHSTRVPANAIRPSCSTWIQDDPQYKTSPGRITAELHERFSSPLYAFAFVLIVLAFVGRAQTTRQSRLSAVDRRLHGGYALPHPRHRCRQCCGGPTVRGALLYAIPIGAGLIAAVATQRRVVPRRPSRLQLLAAGIVDWRRALFGRLLAARRRRQLRRTRGGSLFLSRTLRRYVAKRFLFSIVGAFAVCACLIFMIDMIELLRMSRRATDLSMADLLWMGLLRLPAFAEILFAFAVLVGSIGALLSLNRRSELTVMRSAGMSVWQFLAPGAHRDPGSRVSWPSPSTTRWPRPLAPRPSGWLPRLSARRRDCWRPRARGSWLRQDGADGQSVMNAHRRHPTRGCP